MADPILYYDGRTGYLELHALRAPVGPYATWAQDDDAYNFAIACAVQDFERENKIELYLLGRSGRHVCIEDTAKNRRRYKTLQRKAIAAAREVWADMRTEREPDAVLSEN